MKPEDALPKDNPEAPEPSAEEFHRAASELHLEPEHVAITALKTGIAGFALAAGLLASPPGYAQIAIPAPIAVTETTQEMPSALQVSPMGREGDPPDPSLSPLLQPLVTMTPEGTVAFDFGKTAPSLYANYFTPRFNPVPTLAPPPQPALSIADRFQDRVQEPATLAAAVESLPDWSTASGAFGNAAQGHSGQLLEEPADVLLVLQSDLHYPSELPKATEATKAEAKSYLAELWADLADKLIDPQTAADKIAEELYKLPEHLLLLVGGAVLARLGFKKHGEPDNGTKPAAATESEMAAGLVAVKAFAAGLELRNGVLLQTGRALRRINKLFGGELRSAFAWSLPHIQIPGEPLRSAIPAPARGFSPEDVRSYLNLLSGKYTTHQVDATLATGFYIRVAGRWRFDHIEKSEEGHTSAVELPKH
jgi:hypothetical protein